MPDPHSVTAHSRVVGLIGWPVSHSVSPAMHNAAFDHLGLDWCYIPLPVKPEPGERIRQAVHGLRALGLRGANVTVPHKQAVMPHLDRISPAARAIGAVNTVVVDADGTLIGENTDAPGFIADLRGHNVEPRGRHVIVLGAGGSARAVVYGLAEAGVAHVVVLNRTAARAEALVADLRPLFPACTMEADSLPGAIVRHAAGADLVVNCTALGMTPNSDSTPWDESVRFRTNQVVYDLVYNPQVTRLLSRAAADGAQAVGGLGMLVWQGALAFQRWTGHSAPAEIMYAAAAAAMQSRWEQPAGAPTPAGISQRLSIRRATADDAPAVSALNVFVHQLHADAIPEFFKPPSAHTFPPAMVLELLEKSDTVIFLAEYEGRPIGYLYADLTPAMETSSTYKLERAYIHHVAVDPAYENHGVGTALVDAIKQLAHDQGINVLALSAWTFNERALRFFRRQGFEPYNYRMWLHLQPR